MHQEDPICRLASCLLVGIADHADEGGLGDLAIYLMAARAELVLGPWQMPLDERGPAERGSLTRGISTVLELLDLLRESTDDLDGIVAIAMARQLVLDGVRWLDAAAQTMARAYWNNTIDHRRT